MPRELQMSSKPLSQFSFTLRSTIVRNLFLSFQIHFLFTFIFQRTFPNQQAIFFVVTKWLQPSWKWLEFLISRNPCTQPGVLSKWFVSINCLSHWSTHTHTHTAAVTTCSKWIPFWYICLALTHTSFQMHSIGLALLPLFKSHWDWDTVWTALVGLSGGDCRVRKASPRLLALVLPPHRLP